MSGYGCTTKYIEAKTVKEYLKEINKHYTAHGLPPPWVNTATTKTARLVKDKQTFETEAKRREPLTHECIETMLDLAERYGESEDCFEFLMRDIVALGRYTGNRIQEYAMESPHKIEYYATPDGDVMRAFSVGNILFRDAHGMPLATSVAMETPNLVAQVGTRYDIQKNRNNGQVLWYHRDTLNQNYCPVVRALSLVQRAIRLGQSSSDPLCVYLKNGEKVFLTANDVTNYFRYTMKLAHPTITEEMLSAISTHFTESDSMRPPCGSWKTHLLYQVTIHGKVTVLRFTFEISLVLLCSTCKQLLRQAVLNQTEHTFLWQ